MLTYVWRDLVRNPRRTIASIAGIALGIGLFSGVLFFVDGSGATMTERSLAPLALDMQRVISSPLGRTLRLEQAISPTGRLRAGQDATVTLRVVNSGSEPANEVVVNDEPPPPLAYVHGTMTRDGAPVPDAAGSSPLAQGVARSGLNIGTVPPNSSVTFTYAARANRSVRTVGTLPLAGTVSSREDVIPQRANTGAPLAISQVRTRIARLPGVAAADRLSFVDLGPDSLRSGTATVEDPVRVFAFDRTYRRHYPSIRLARGSFTRDGALLSAEAARHLGVHPGDTVQVTVPGRAAPLSLPVSGVVDLSRATPLFSSRKTSELERFIYVPDAIVVSPAVFDDTIVPAYQAAAATLGNQLKTFPVLEVDALVDRDRLQSDPARAFAQTKAIARSIQRVAPGQDYLIDNISNTLQVARDDARVGKRTFLFLGLPGVVLAAFLAAYAGTILADAQRREQATLRIRGAHALHLRRMLLYRTAALAGAGSILGAALGFVAVMAILGTDTLFSASAGQLVVSGLIGAAVGMAVTALALYVPGRRALRREITQERREIAASTTPAWQRWGLDFALLGIAIVAEVVAVQSGAFDAPVTSVAAGEAVSLPSYLLVAPMLAWAAGVLVAVRVSQTLAGRIRLPNPRFGPLVGGTMRRSLRRRPRALATGIAGVGLVSAFGVGIVIFAATYDEAKAADARFTVGADLRITPSALSPRPHPPAYGNGLRVQGVAGVTPVVSELDNSVLIGPNNQDRETLTAIDPSSFERVAALSDAFFVGRTAASAMAALRADPRGVLVDRTTADDLEVAPGDRVQVLLARGTKQQVLESMRVVGLYKRFPGFPEGTNLVANLGFYRDATHLDDASFFLARVGNRSRAGIDRAVAALRAGPAREDPINVESTATSLDKDRSSLTALNVTGLVDLDSLFTLLMSAAAIAIFVFGLMLQRRREYVTLRALGARAGQVRALVVGEAGIVVVSGLVAGIAVGTAMAFLLVRILRPLFVLDPGTTFATGDVAGLAALVLAAGILSALAATAILRRLDPTSLLRET
ncbi:MAG TPA: FtsX-like permease family protein [Acidimicrobiia bacterium]